METITDNMYMNLIHKHSRLLLSTQKRLQRSQILLLDFDVYLKNRSSQINHCLFYVYKDSLPDYCSNRLHEFTSPVCIKHLDLCVLTSVWPLHKKSNRKETQCCPHWSGNSPHSDKDLDKVAANAKSQNQQAPKKKQKRPQVKRPQVKVKRPQVKRRAKGARQAEKWKNQNLVFSSL